MSHRKFVYENVISLPKLSLPSQEIKSKERGSKKEHKRKRRRKGGGGEGGKSTLPVIMPH